MLKSEKDRGEGAKGVGFKPALFYKWPVMVPVQSIYTKLRSKKYDAVRTAA